ncbi:MAG: hypothetical protein WDW38_002619 [Sanguina aurantia]
MSQGISDGAPSAAHPRPDVTEFSCPICLELMYKPTVNQCGHAMCFWCNHRSMNPYSPSACPLCRAPYTQFPKVCVPLHSFLVWAFPKQHALRDAENKDLEFSSSRTVLQQVRPEQKVESQWVPERGSSASSGTAPSLSSYICDNPDCRKLLHQPCVLGCGHIPGCPACSCRVSGGGGACHKLHSALEVLFPEQVKLRAAQVQLEVESARLRLASTSSGGTAVGTGPAGPSTQSRRRPRSKIPEIDSLAAAGVDRGTLWGRTRELLSSQGDSIYTWYQVGCDACGAYPIKGRRYRCTECPESIGYDLCGSCRDACPDGRGRFNQNHKASHTMLKMEPVLGLGATPEQASTNISAVGFMNMLEVLHPELSVQEAMNLMTLQVRMDDEDEAMLLEGGGDLTQESSESEDLAGAETNPHDVRADTESESSEDEADARQPVPAHTHLSTPIITSRPTRQGPTSRTSRHPASDASPTPGTGHPASDASAGGVGAANVHAQEQRRGVALGSQPVVVAGSAVGAQREGESPTLTAAEDGQAETVGTNAGRRGCAIM